MKIVAGTRGVESHYCDLTFEVDGAIQFGDGEGEVGEQGPELLVDVILGFHLLNALLQSMILMVEGKKCDKGKSEKHWGPRRNGGGRVVVVV